MGWNSSSLRRNKKQDRQEKSEKPSKPDRTNNTREPFGALVFFGAYRSCEKASEAEEAIPLKKPPKMFPKKLRSPFPWIFPLFENPGTEPP